MYHVREIKAPLFFLFQKVIVPRNEFFDLVSHPQQLCPLLFVKRDGKAS